MSLIVAYRLFFFKFIVDGIIYKLEIITQPLVVGLFYTTNAEKNIAKLPLKVRIFTDMEAKIRVLDFQAHENYDNYFMVIGDDFLREMHFSAELHIRNQSYG